MTAGFRRYFVRVAHGVPLGGRAPRVRLPYYLLAKVEDLGTGRHLGTHLVQTADPLGRAGEARLVQGKLSRLDTPNIQALYSAKLRDGLKPSSVRYMHAVLHHALSKAVDLSLIARNPAASADPSKVRHEELTPLDTDQTRVLLDAARGPKYEALYVLSLTCRLRMDESLGLKWSDIDLDAGTLRVNHQLQRIREGGGLVFSEPKNASRRTLDLPQRALEALRSHRKRQLEEKLRSSRQAHT